MFTPYMTNEELQEAAYKDFLELRTRIRIAFDRFLGNLRLSERQKRAIHSLEENYTLRSRANNTWNITFRYLGYKSDHEIKCCYMVYTPLWRENGVDYLFWSSMSSFHLERFSTHFIQRYKERYLEPKGIDLKGMNPAFYFLLHNDGRRRTNYLPKDWTEKDLAEKSFYISPQGLSLVKDKGKITTYITFLDQENLSRYKAQVYEEEQVFRLFNEIAYADDFLERQALFRKLCADLERTKRLLKRYFWRSAQTDEQREQLNNLDTYNIFDMIAEQTNSIEESLDKQFSSLQPKSTLDVFGLTQRDQMTLPKRSIKSLKRPKLKRDEW